MSKMAELDLLSAACRQSCACPSMQSALLPAQGARADFTSVVPVKRMPSV